VKDEKLNIFTTQQCFSEDFLLKYSNNELSKNESRMVELHLCDCEICNDILDGLSNLKNKSELNLIVKNLNNQIDEKLKSHNKIVYFNFRKIIPLAASIILLLGISIFLIKNLNQNKNYVSQDLASVKSENMIEETNQNEKIDETSETKKADLQLESEKVDKTIEKNLIAENNYYIEEIVTEIDLKSEEFINLSHADFTDFEQIVLYTESSSVLSAPVFADIQTVAKADENISSQNMGLAFDDFVEEDYKNAKQNFETEITENPNNDTAVFYNGLSEYQLQNFTKAEKIFNQIILNPNSNFYESALYFKAQTLINKGEKKNAIEILNKVLTINGKYYDIAKKQLEDLQK